MAESHSRSLSGPSYLERSTPNLCYAPGKAPTLHSVSAPSRYSRAKQTLFPAWSQGSACSCWGHWHLLEVHLTLHSSLLLKFPTGMGYACLPWLIFYLKPGARRLEHTPDHLAYFLLFVLLCLTSSQEQKGYFKKQTRKHRSKNFLCVIFFPGPDSCLCLKNRWGIFAIPEGELNDLSPLGLIG